MKFSCSLLLAVSVASSPLEVINYSDAEAGHGHVMSGTPGEAVEGEFYWKAPEGDDLKLVYTADMAGFVATGDHLPVSPEVPAAPEMALPVMVELTPEVAEARAAFMQKFEEVKARSEAMDEDVVVMAPERRRRDAEADAQIFLTQPLSYAPSYPYYFVNNLVPTVKNVEEPDMKEADMIEEEPMKVPEADMVEDAMDPRKYYVPLYAPSYYYPSQVYYPAGLPPSSAKTTVTQTATPWFRVPAQHPAVSYYPGLYPGFVSTVPQVSVPEERILPSETQAGEDESAALLL